MRKTEAYASLKTGQNKASPTESEIHPSHKPAVYAPGYFAIASSQTQLLAGVPDESRVSSGLCSEDRSCGGPSPLKISINRYFFSPVSMAFPYRQRSRTARQSGDPAAHKSLRKIHARRTYFAEIILLYAAMILQKYQPLCLPGNGRMLVTASPKQR